MTDRADGVSAGTGTGTHFAGLDHHVCDQAWEILKPVVRRCAELDVTEEAVGTVVVLDPRFTACGHEGHIASPDVLAQAGAVLFEGCLGPREPNAEYRTFALAKAFVSWRTGMPSRVVQQEAPHLLDRGMTKWGGSTVKAGLVVAYSGVESLFDEMFAEMLASAILALCRYEVMRPGGLLPAGPDFL